MSKNTLSTNRNSLNLYWDINEFNKREEQRKIRRLEAKQKNEKLRKRNIKIAIGVLAVTAAGILFSVFGRGENSVANAKTATKQEQEFKGDLDPDISVVKEVNLPVQSEVSITAEAEQGSPEMDWSENEATQIEQDNYVLKPEDADSYYEETLSAEDEAHKDNNESISLTEEPEKNKVSYIELPEETKKMVEVQMSRINQLKPIYQEAAEIVGIPWQIAAALHYREANNNPKCSMWAGELLGTKNPDDGEIKPTNKKDNYVSALRHFLDMANEVYGIKLEDLQGPEIDFDVLCASGTGYNRGHKYERGDMSYTLCPYSTNGLPKDKFLNMRWPTKGGRFANGNTYGETSSLAGELEQRAGLVAVAVDLGLKVKW
jgi:hypothetical protein